jgi:hypothetical protein
METLADIRSQVRTSFGEAGTVRLTDARLDEAINAGIDELAENVGFRESFAVLDLKSGRTYYDVRQLFPDEAVMITSIWNPELRLWLRYTPHNQFTYPRWETTNGSPQSWFMRGLFHLGVYPHDTSSGEKLHVYFTIQHTPLVNAEDPLVDVAPDMVQAVADYTLFDLHLQERQAERAQEALSAYHKGLSLLDYHTGNRVSRARTGQIGGRR